MWKIILQKLRFVTKGVHTFTAKSTADIEERAFRKEPEFFSKMLSEKRYDLRQNLIAQIYKEGLIEEKITFDGKKTIVELKLKVKK